MIKLYLGRFRKNRLAVAGLAVVAAYLRADDLGH